MLRPVTSEHKSGAGGWIGEGVCTDRSIIFSLASLIERATTQELANLPDPNSRP